MILNITEKFNQDLHHKNLKLYLIQEVVFYEFLIMIVYLWDVKKDKNMIQEKVKLQKKFNIKVKYRLFKFLMEQVT